MARLLPGPIGAGAAKADLDPGVSCCPQCFGQLVGMAAEKVHRFRSIKGQHHDQPVRCLHVRLKRKPDMAKFFRRKGQGRGTVVPARQGCGDPIDKMGQV